MLSYDKTTNVSMGYDKLLSKYVFFSDEDGLKKLHRAPLNEWLNIYFDDWNNWFKYFFKT